MSNALGCKVAVTNLNKVYDDDVNYDDDEGVQ